MANASGIYRRIMHQRRNIEGRALLGGAFERQSTVFTFGDADAATHASLVINVIHPVRQREGVKLAKLGTFTAPSALGGINRGPVS